LAQELMGKEKQKKKNAITYQNEMHLKTKCLSRWKMKKKVLIK
jgi:hypothetical protein